MHGTYTHRVTCNLHPEQFFRLQQVAQQFNSRLAPFMRDAALAYIDRRTMLPASLKRNLTKIIQEVRRVGTNLNQIAKRANTYQRLTHDDLRKAAQLVVMMERLVLVLRQALESLPHDHQVDVEEE